MANLHGKACRTGRALASSRNSQGSSEVSHLIPAHNHHEGLEHKHPTGSGHTAAGEQAGDVLGLPVISCWLSFLEHSDVLQR